MAGHCIRHPELSVHQPILWEPSHSNYNRGRRRLNYMDKDTGVLEKHNIRTRMPDRDVWRELSHANDRVEDQQDHPRN